jgi:hypothetical protein
MSQLCVVAGLASRISLQLDGQGSISGRGRDSSYTVSYPYGSFLDIPERKIRLVPMS